MPSCSSSNFGPEGTLVAECNRTATWRIFQERRSIIDEQIAWEGSLNILAHKNSFDQMRRWVFQKVAAEVLENLPF